MPNPIYLDYNATTPLDQEVIDEVMPLVSKAEQDARKDLTVLDVPSGCDRKVFEKQVAAILDQMPLVNEIDRKVASDGLSDEAAVSFIENNGDLVHTPKEHWKIFKTWLTYFFPERYRLRSTSEEVLRSSVVRRR
ncbi:MAG: hypothetical protein WD037_05660 [Balneolales bacterium]